ncbi:hypothetical protein [Pseudomonas retamae]|uniref:Uncharacterized protein n=1 Tax=Pseudomonas retamae TaxID=702110 RepID=A0ABW7D8E9_9PSED
MIIFPSALANAHNRRACSASALPSDAMKGYLRRSPAPSQVELKRMPACVAAKQNGFWQPVN